MPTGWKTVSKALVHSFGYGGIGPCARCGWQLDNSAPAFACSMWHDGWVDDALAARSWSSGDLFDERENDLSQ